MTNSTEFLDSKEAIQNVQKEDQPAVQAEVTAPQQEESLYADMVGEGKKFSSPEDLAKAKIESDTHIAKIEEENAELRKKNEASSNNYAAILDKLETKENNNVSTIDKDASKNSNAPEEEIDLDEWFENKLTQRDQKRIEKSNMEVSKNLMVEAYGNLETAKHVRDKFLQEKPYMQDVLNTLISNDPEQLLKEMKQFIAPDSVGDLAVNPLSTVPSVHRRADDEYITYEQAKEVFRTDKIRYGSDEFTKLVEDSAAYYESKGVNYYN